MRRVLRLVASVAVVMGALGGLGVASAGANFSYTFDSNNQGWRTDDGNGNTPPVSASWLGTGGNPGGRIDVSDTFNAASSAFLTPSSGFAGDYSSNFGGTLSFDVKSTPAWSPGHGVVVEMFGAGNSVVCAGSNVVPGTSYQTAQFTLNGANMFGGPNCSTQASDADVAQVLSTLQGMVIPGEDGPNTGETTLLDNVSLSGGAPLAKHTLSLSKSGNGSGTVTSSPAGIDCGGTCSADFFQGATVTLTATPAAGQTFAGWSGAGCSGTGTCVVTMNSNAAVTATFNAPVQHTLSVVKAGAGSGTVTSTPAGIDCGATCSHAYDEGTSVTLNASAASGSSFAGWSGGGCSGTGACTVTMGSEQAVAATFNENAPPPPPVPNTSISKATIDSSKGTAIFKFKGKGTTTGFQCALVSKHKKPKFKKCKSPKKYKHLKKGKYTFEVRALNAAGADKTPAKSKFKIK